MKARVVALGLDATDPGVLERWMDAGVLPRLAALRREGAFSLVQNVRYYRTETSWITFLTGALPEQSGAWGHVDYDPATYAIHEHAAYPFDRHPPFYTRLAGRRVCIFDPPLAQPVDDVDGLQVLGWGTEVNQCLRVSRPAPLMSELIARHGAHPLFEEASWHRADGEGEGDVLSYRIPSTYDVAALDDLADRLCVGAARRGAIMRDLLAREPWDFFLGVFSETHTASHLLWHLSQPHPLHASLASGMRDDPMRRVFQAVDRAVGEVVAALPPDVHLTLFSIYGIGANVLDLPSMAFLPETLYRASCAGEHALTGSDASNVMAGHAHWKDAVWALVDEGAQAHLESPQAQAARGDPLAWQPANWYRPSWPRMRAFALPTYSEGLVRINVAGREAQGIVPVHEFATTCAAVEGTLRALRDAHTGHAMVREVIRTRDAAFERGRGGAPADLIVLWQEEAPTDCVESAHLGRIGPLPYFRSGGHSSQGFVLSRGPGIAAGTRAPDIAAQDLTAVYRGWLA